MIYFFYNQDKQALHKKASKLFLSLQTKKPDAAFISLDGENVSISALSEVFQSQGLFEQKIVAYLRNIISDSELEKEISKKIPELSKSQNIFIWTEYDLLKDELSLLKKHAEKSDIVDPSTSSGQGKNKREEFTIFSLADAFGKRDKKILWALFQKAKIKASAEEIHGILFWQLKSMAQAEASKTAAEAGLAPFVFSKAKGFARNYSKDELKKISGEFVEMYHDAHRGKGDFMGALERWVLGM